MNTYKVGYFLNGTAYAEHIAVSARLDMIDACFVAMDRVKAANPTATGVTAQRIK